MPNYLNLSLFLLHGGVRMKKNVFFIILLSLVLVVASNCSFAAAEEGDFDDFNDNGNVSVILVPDADWYLNNPSPLEGRAEPIQDWLSPEPDDTSVDEEVTQARVEDESAGYASSFASSSGSGGAASGYGEAATPQGLNNKGLIGYEKEQMVVEGGREAEPGLVVEKQDGLQKITEQKNEEADEPVEVGKAGNLDAKEASESPEKSVFKRLFLWVKGDEEKNVEIKKEVEKSGENKPGEGASVFNRLLKWLKS